MAILTVARDKGWTDKFRRYRIVLDGEEIGHLAEDEVLEHAIADGPHRIDARIDWCGSGPVEFEVRGEDRLVLVRSGLRGWRFLLTLPVVLFARNRYLRIELDPASRPR